MTVPTGKTHACGWRYRSSGPAGGTGPFASVAHRSTAGCPARKGALEAAGRRSCGAGKKARFSESRRKRRQGAAQQRGCGTNMPGVRGTRSTETSTGAASAGRGRSSSEPVASAESAPKRQPVRVRRRAAKACVVGARVKCRRGAVYTPCAGLQEKEKEHGCRGKSHRCGSSAVVRAPHCHERPIPRCERLARYCYAIATR